MEIKKPPAWEAIFDSTPSEELMTCALGNRGVDLDAKLAKAVDNGLTLDEVFSTPVHIEVVNLLVELVGIGKDTIVGSLHVEAEYRSTKSTEPGELIKVLEHNIERLVTTP